MTRDELMAEQFGRSTSGECVGQPLPAWTAAEVANHLDELAAAIGVGRRVQRIRAHVLANLAPTPTIRQQLIDDLPPDSRPGPTIVIRAARP